MEQLSSADQALLYAVEQQLALIRDRVRDVAGHRHTSVYISGPSGVGKTFHVRRTLDELGEPYVYHSGHVTPLGFFDLIKENPDDTIVLDDVSSLFRQPVGQQLLLAALGNYYAGDWTRTVSYRRRGKDEVVRFSGGLIALSNLSLHNDAIMTAIKSRTKPMLWSPTEPQLAAIMRNSVKEGWGNPCCPLTAAEALTVTEFVVGHCHRYGVAPDLRLLFETALPDFAANKMGEHEADWRDHALAAIRERVRRPEYSGPPKTRAQQIEMERRIVERIRAQHASRAEQVEAWVSETGKSERAYDRRSAELRN
jgi:hypothetical protein